MLALRSVKKLGIRGINPVPVLRILSQNVEHCAVSTLAVALMDHPELVRSVSMGPCSTSQPVPLKALLCTLCVHGCTQAHVADLFERGRQYPLPTLPALSVLINELYYLALCSIQFCLQLLHFRYQITATLANNDYSAAWQFQRNLADFVELLAENSERERPRDPSPLLVRYFNGSADAACCF